MNGLIWFALGVLVGPVVVKIFTGFIFPTLKKLWGKVDNKVDDI